MEDGAHQTTNAGYYPFALSVKTRESGPSGARELPVKSDWHAMRNWHGHVCEFSTHLFGPAVQAEKKVCA